MVDNKDKLYPKTFYFSILLLILSMILSNKIAKCKEIKIQFKSENNNIM